MKIRETVKYTIEIANNGCPEKRRRVKKPSAFWGSLVNEKKQRADEFNNKISNYSPLNKRQPVS